MPSWNITENFVQSLKLWKVKIKSAVMFPSAQLVVGTEVSFSFVVHMVLWAH